MTNKPEEKTSEATLVTAVAEVDEPVEARDACLVVIYGGELGKKYNLEQRSIMVGRATSCDIQVDQEEISRNHCKLVNKGDSVQICDLESTNGTYVNDRQVKVRNLYDGDLVKFGRTIMKFLSSGNIEHAYHEEIYNLSTMDGLTQAHNRRYLVDNLDREISRARRYSRDLSIIILDLDHFKRINDIFGHLAGDHVLKQLTSAIKLQIRLEDILARYGGEEFVIILPEVDTEGAIKCAEKIRQLIEDTEFNFEGARLPVTISLGIASCTSETADAADLIQKADEKLYDAKHKGRNRVEG